MTMLKVKPEQLRATAGEFSTQGAKMVNYVHEMISAVCSMGASWQGEANESYKNKFNKLEDDLLVLNKMIQEHVTDLNNMADLYTNAEQSNADIANALQSDIIS